MNEDALRARWFALWERVSPSEPRQWVGAVFEQLYFAYAEPRRAYHNGDHIAYCLGMANAHRFAANDPDAVEMAVWFHDAIYHSQRRPEGLPSNEALSAQFADDILVHSEVSLAFRERVTGLILATQHTPETVRTSDQMLIADIDWSPIGWSWKTFERNREKIRLEYGHLSYVEFASGRKASLIDALNRKSQFYLPAFKKKFEERALQNLRKELELFAA